MNNARRKRIQSALKTLRLANCTMDYIIVWSVVSNVRGEEFDIFENMSESMQNSKRGEAFLDTIDLLMAAEDDLTSIINVLDRSNSLSVRSKDLIEKVTDILIEVAEKK